MKRITRRDFVTNSIVGGAAATAVTGPVVAAQDRPAATAKTKIVGVSCSPRAGKTRGSRRN